MRYDQLQLHDDSYGGITDCRGSVDSLFIAGIAAADFEMDDDEHAFWEEVSKVSYQTTPADAGIE